MNALPGLVVSVLVSGGASLLRRARLVVGTRKQAFYEAAD